MTIYHKRTFFYIIEDIRNGMYYAGSKYGKDANPEKFMVEGGYTTSSTNINKLIEEFGLKIFIIRKMKIFDTSKEAISYETRFLKKVNARINKRFYNLHNNDNTFDTEKNKFITEIVYGNGITNISQTTLWKEKFKVNKDIIMEKKRNTIIETWDDGYREQLKKKKQDSWKTSSIIKFSKSICSHLIEEIALTLAIVSKLNSKYAVS